MLAVAADVTSQADVDALVAETIDRFGRIDLLVNNAGRSCPGRSHRHHGRGFQRADGFEPVGLVRCTRAAMPHLLATRGHLVNIGSLAGKTAARYMGAYSATKYAVSAYSQQLRLELGPQGLHVLLVSPGPIARDEPRHYDAAKTAHLPASARKPGAGVKVNLIRPEKLAQRILVPASGGAAELVVPGRARLVFAISQLWPDLGDWIIRKMS